MEGEDQIFLLLVCFVFRGQTSKTDQTDNIYGQSARVVVPLTTLADKACYLVVVEE